MVRSRTSRPGHREPAMRRGRAGVRTRCRRGAAGLLFFMLIGLPVMFFSAALTVDFTMQIIAFNQAESTADAVARAASFQQRLDQDRIERTRARTAARQTFDRTQDAGVMSMTRDAQLQGNTVRFRDNDRTAEVTITYRLRMRNFTAWLSAASLGDLNSQVFEVTRRASVCTPGDNSGSTAGNCARPD